MMQFHDLAAQYQALKKDIDAGIADVLSKGHFILGEQVTELENKLAADVGRKHCVCCANGTDALELALMMWDIGKGDAVFTADFTYFASAGTASRIGAELIPVDIDLDTFNICPDALEEAIERFKPAHLQVVLNPTTELTGALKLYPVLSGAVYAELIGMAET